MSRTSLLQARASSLEAQLEQATAQLQELEVLQEAHRVKIKLLEKLVHLNKQSDMKSVHELPPAEAVSTLYPHACTS